MHDLGESHAQTDGERMRGLSLVLLGAGPRLMIALVLVALIWAAIRGVL
jgi:hypothetical protein